MDVTSPLLTPGRACSYGAAISLLRRFISLYQEGLAADDEYIKDDFSKVTMHSLRAWLATFLRQLHVPKDQINDLLHWSSGEMLRCYDRNFDAVEVALRRRITGVLASGWRSAGKGHVLQEPVPQWNPEHTRTERY